MRTSRRTFVRMAAGALGFAAVLLAPLRPLVAWAAQAAERAAERWHDRRGWARRIHEGTANTRLGALGERVRGWVAGRSARNAHAQHPRTPVPTGAHGAERPLDEALHAASLPQVFSGEALEWPELARCLHLANGVTGRSPVDRPLRAAPSAGALYAGEVYVVVRRVRGLDPGVHYYAPLSSELVRLAEAPGASAKRTQTERERAIEDEAAFAAALRDACEGSAGLEGAAAFVVLTNVFARYRRRYANRGYRYALIDSGHIGENLRIAAAATGLHTQRVDRMRDDAWNGWLAVDGVDEAVCAVHALGRSKPAPAAAPPQTRHSSDAPQKPHTAPAPPPRLVERGRLGPLVAPRADDLPERFHEATKLVWARVPQAAAPSAPTEAPLRCDPTPAEAGAPALALPVLRSTAAPRTTASAPRADRRSSDASRAASGGAPPAARSAGAAIEARRSPLGFERRPVSLEQLAALLDAAARGLPALGSNALEVRVALHRVSGATPGLYRFDPGARQLARLRSATLADALVAQCLGQRMAGDASVAFLIAGCASEAIARGGARAYRELLLDAGALAQRVYLAAESLGLGARNLAAFFDASLNEFAQLDVEQQVVLHLIVAGWRDVRAG